MVSIEAWHDHVHDLVGAGSVKGASGHMAHSEVAGVRFSSHSFFELIIDFLGSSTPSFDCIIRESYHIKPHLCAIDCE